MVARTALTAWRSRSPAARCGRYRGYDIEELVHKSTFLEVAFLLIYGELPDQVRSPAMAWWVQWRGR